MKSIWRWGALALILGVALACAQAAYGCSSGDRQHGSIRIVAGLSNNTATFGPGTGRLGAFRAKTVATPRPGLAVVATATAPETLHSFYWICAADLPVVSMDVFRMPPARASPLHA